MCNDVKRQYVKVVREAASSGTRGGIGWYRTGSLSIAA